MNNAFFMSVFAGLVTIVVGWFLNEFFKKIVIPSYLAYTYKGANISGKWYCNYKENKSMNPSQTISINQNGPKVNGEILIREWADGTTTDRVLSFTGEIKGDKFQINYSHSDKPDILFGSIILKILDDGERLNGWAIGIEPYDTTVYADKRTWVKDIKSLSNQ